MENPTKQIRVALYIRVSTEEQSRHGYGKEMQEASLREAIAVRAKHNNWITHKDWIFIDSGTGADLKRPGFKDMMEMAKQKKFDVVATWKIDRISRNLSHLLKVFETLQKYGIGFFSLKENVDFSGPIGKLTFQIFGALAEFERETIKARTLEGKRASARLGNVVSGTPPFGYRKKKRKGKGNTYEIIKKEAKWVEKIFDWFIFDELSYSEIARKLTGLNVLKGEDSSHRKKRSSKWNDNSVRDVLKRKTYTGKKTEKLADGEGGHILVDVDVPQIISPYIFEQAKYRMDIISETKGKKGGGLNLYLLSRKIIDMETTRKFIGYTRGKGGIGYRRKGFKNSDGKKYKNKEIPGKPLDDFVWEQIKLAINKPKEFFKIYKRQRFHHREYERLKNQIELFKNEALDAHESLETVYDEFFTGNISEERKNRFELRYSDKVKKCEKEIKKTEKEISKIEEIKTATEVLDKFSKSFKNKLNKLSPEQKKIIIELFLDKIEVSEDKKGIKVNVFYRFAQETTKPATIVDEPDEAINKTKNTPNGVSSECNGGRTRTRT